MPYSLTEIATEAEIHAECVEDHSPFEYIREDGGFSISMNGHYSAGELEWASRVLAEANRFYVPPDLWPLRLEYVRAWRAFKQNPTPSMMSVIQQLTKKIKKQK